MLKKGDKIEISKFGVVLATDEVVRVINGLAYTKFGKRYPFKSKVLRPLKGRAYGHSYKLILE
jgi:hypothetical protein